MRTLIPTLALLGAAGLPCTAQEPAPARVEPLDIVGDSFAGLRLSPGVVDGPLEFRATRIQRWSVPGATRADGTSEPTTHRLLLSGDVSMQIAVKPWSAARAAVWLAPLPPGDPDAAPNVYQVFIFFDRAFTPQEDPSVGIAADRLPVHGVVKATTVSIKGDLITEGRPDEGDAPFMREAERALAVRLRARLQGRTPEPQSPDELARQRRPIPPLFPGLERSFQSSPADDPARIRELEQRLGPAQRDEPIFAKTGVISFAVKGVATTVPGPDETSITITGGVTVQYWERSRNQTLELTAERAVIFVDPDSPRESMQFDASKVRGLYLEGDVVGTINTPQGRYTVRAPKVFYSIKDDRALLLDAVFWTFDEKRGLPLYVRAKTISQESADTFKATGATLTNTAFFEPDFAIGTRSVTLTRRRTPEGDSRVFVDARHITLEAAGIPFFYWPILRGDPQAIPIRSVSVDSSTGSGTALRTTWNLWSLLGVRPEGAGDADLLVDWHFGRGAGIGTRMNWDRQSAQGGLFVYTLPEDTGRDVLVTGAKKELDGQWRGLALAEHTAKLSENWTFTAEAAYISDETFIDGLFEEMSTTRREFASAVEARRLYENTALWAAARGSFNDFISNQYLKQSQGYTVEKTPDIGYVRIADDLIDSAPGVITYTSEYRLSRMRMRFDESRADEFGFRNPAQAQSAFGINPNQSLGDRLRAEGFTEDPVTRFDTRHEMDFNLSAGPVNIRPFVTGRVTVYDTEFDAFSGYGSTPADDDTRLWSSQGVNVTTELQRVDNSVESRLFDLHRMRHIVQPGVTVWHAGSSIDRVDLPVYDDEVESLAEGSATRVSLNQTWQTQRGGPGRWRSVDVFKLNAGATASSNDTDIESPIGRFFEYRPELSNLGSFGDITGSWQVSEVLAIGGMTVYDFDNDHLQKTVLGATLQHTPDFSTFADLRTINSQDQTFLTLGASYELTRKYALDVSGSYDTDQGNFQTISGQITRRFPSMTLGLASSYNHITDVTSFSVILRPVGSTRPGARLQALGPSR